MSAELDEKLTSLSLYRFLKNKNLPYEEWEININGEMIVIENERIIDSILTAPLEEQKALADALAILLEEGGDINEFLKHLILMSHE